MRYASFLPTVASLWLATTPLAHAADYWMYVGTYTNQQSKGIYGFRFHASTGKLTPIGLVAETAAPSFLAVHPNGRLLYAVNEISSYGGERSGSVSAFRVNPATGRLSAINTVSSRGPGPCHLAIDRTGKCLMVANYEGGSVAVFPIAQDGRLSEAASFIQHSGSGTRPDRQAGPHAHCIAISPDNRFALVADLGLDQVRVYRLNPSESLAAPGDPAFAKTAGGAGPRHLAFHPGGRLVYSVNELQSSITAFAYDPAAGRLREIQTVSTLPEDFHGQNTTAEIEVHSSGKFLYASNRGHDSIAVYKIARGTGLLTLVQHVPSGGRTPRSFSIDPTGKYLLAANQNSNNIVVFRIDASTGRLAANSEEAAAPTPVCLKFTK